MTILQLMLTIKEDLPNIIEIENHQDNSRFIGAYPLERHYEVIENPDELHLTFKDQEKIIGYAILLGLTNPNNAIEFKRIAIAEKGKGYGRAAVKAVKKYCFEKLNCHRLWLDVFEFNTRALYLYKSEGFKEEGLLRECIKMDDGYKNLILMSLLKPEYEALKPKNTKA